MLRMPTSPLRGLVPGAKLDELRLTPSRSQLFMFSAVTWNRHQIHFDKDRALAEGFPDIAVQRGLIGNFLARMMTSWAGSAGRLERLRWKVTKSAFPDQELRCQGEISEISEDPHATRVSCQLQIINPKCERVAVGEARMRFTAALKNEKGSST